MMSRTAREIREEVRRSRRRKVVERRVEGRTDDVGRMRTPGVDPQKEWVLTGIPHPTLGKVGDEVGLVGLDRRFEDGGSGFVVEPIRLFDEVDPRSRARAAFTRKLDPHDGVGKFPAVEVVAIFAAPERIAITPRSVTFEAEGVGPERVAQVPFAEPATPVPGIPECRSEEAICRVKPRATPEPPLVLGKTMVVGVEPGEHRGPRRRADGQDGVGPVEDHPPFCQPSLQRQALRGCWPVGEQLVVGVKP